MQSLGGQPLLVCPQCGALHGHDGALLVAGAAETNAEIRLRGTAGDMANLRDGFGVVVLGSEVGAIWTLVANVAYPMELTVGLIAIGVGAVIPFAYFAQKTRHLKRELKTLRQARRAGDLPS